MVRNFDSSTQPFQWDSPTINIKQYYSFFITFLLVFSSSEKLNDAIILQVRTIPVSRTRDVNNAANYYVYAFFYYGCFV